MKVNWLVRIKNKTFWITFIPTIILLVQVVASIFGLELDFGELGNKLMDVVEIVFTLLAILGIITDPTTSGVSDSTQALTYTKPKKEV